MPSTRPLSKELGRARSLLRQGRELRCWPSERRASPDPSGSPCLGHCLGHSDVHAKLLSLVKYAVRIQTRMHI